MKKQRKKESNYKKIIFIFLIVILIALAFLIYQTITAKIIYVADYNYNITNFGFETDSNSDSIPDFWSNGTDTGFPTMNWLTWGNTTKALSTKKHNGTYSLNMSTYSDASTAATFSDFIPVDLSTKYLLGVWAKSLRGKERIWVGWMEYNETKKPVNSTDWSSFVNYFVKRGDSSPIPTTWTYYSASSKPFNSKTKYIRIVLAGPNYAIPGTSDVYGTVFWDDVDFYQLCNYNNQCDANENSTICSDCSSAQSTCGNNITDAGEDCDGTNLNNQTCSSLGFSSGNLSCSSCLFNTSLCITQSTCGNNITDAGEDCDGTNLNNQTCSSLGFSSGNLSCSSCLFNTSLCIINESNDYSSVGYCGDSICDSSIGEDSNTCPLDCPNISVENNEQTNSEDQTQTEQQIKSNQDICSASGNLCQSSCNSSQALTEQNCSDSTQVCCKTRETQESLIQSITNSLNNLFKDNTSIVIIILAVLIIFILILIIIFRPRTGVTPSIKYNPPYSPEEQSNKYIPQPR